MQFKLVDGIHDTATLWVGLCSNVQDAKSRGTEMDTFHHHKFVQTFQQTGSGSHGQEASDVTSISNPAHIKI